MKLANITSIYKLKGPKKSLESDRGIFVLTVIRGILDRLLYNDLYPEVEFNMSNSNIGALKNKNVRNHLFVVHGIINSVVKGEAKCIDIQIYDIKQAFDSLWLQDCMNDLYDSLPVSGRNDKLSLLYKANCDNHVAVKTPVGQTDRTNIQEIVMQGGTWGPLKCSNSMDKIGKLCENTGEHLYSYKSIVRVPILTMVDDTFAIAECGHKSLAINQFINSHIELKKLQMHTPDESGKTKCHKIHVGGSNLACPQLHVHGTIMEQVKEDSYLGDLIRSDGRNTSSLRNRVSRGVGCLSQISNLLERVSFGKYYFQIALILREAIFLNSILTNIEVWYGLRKYEIEELETLDRILLCEILALPRTTPSEALFLESGCLNIGTIVKMRRLNYLQYLLKCDENAMLSKFFKAQLNFPVKDDWTEQAIQDLRDFNITENLHSIKMTSVYKWRKLVKKRGREYALAGFNREKKSHSKLENIEYNELKLQCYLKNKNISVSQAHTLLKFRTRMANYSNNYGGANSDVCKLCENHSDNQEEITICDFNEKNVRLEGSYKDLFVSDVNVTLAKSLDKLYKLRERKLT